MVTRPWRVLPALIASAAIFGCGGGGNAGTTAATTQASRARRPGTWQHLFRSAGLVYAAPVNNVDAAGNTTVSVAVLSQDGIKTITTGAIPAASVTAVRATLVPGNLVDWERGAAADSAVVAPDPAKTFGVILRKGNSAAAQFDMSKYGPEVTRHNDIPGPMVAAGWVYNKTGNTITVGDGRIVTEDMAGRPYEQPIKRYEETFTVSPTVKVFNVNTSSLRAERRVRLRVDPGHGRLPVQHDAAPGRLLPVRPQPPGRAGRARDRDLVLHAAVDLRRQAGLGRADAEPAARRQGHRPGLRPALHRDQRHRRDAGAVHAQHRAVRDGQEHDVLRRRQRSGVVPVQGRHGHRGPERRQGHQGRRRLAQQRLPVLAQHGDARHRSALGHRHLADARARRPLRQLRRAVADDGQRRQTA